MAGYANFEPLLEDARVERIASQVRSALPGVPDNLTFLTFIQPATTTQREGIVLPLPPVAVFAVISQNPRHPGFQLMTQASAWLEEWRRDDIARLHFVSGSVDPALPIFKLVAAEQIRQLDELKAMI